jgi:carboxypeptidase PM20D1
MKTFFRFLLWLFIILVLVIIIKAFTFRSKQTEVSSGEMPVFDTGSAAKLAGAIKFPTVSWTADAAIDTSVFEDYIKFIGDKFPLVDSLLEKERFNSFSLLYKWQGKNASLRPAVLMAHYDVVPAGDTAAWSFPAFSGKDDGTYIWGRGTLDDKAAMISILEAVERLISEGFVPERTVYLSFGHDEELDGENGAKAIASALKDRGIAPDFVLDEGLAVTKGMVPMMKKPVALIGTSEKGYVSVKLTAELPGGHSSTPAPESALLLVAEAVTKLAEQQPAARISGPVNDFIKFVGPEMPFHAKAIFANKWLFSGIIKGIYEGSASGNALVRTTTAATVFNSGIKDNVIPTKAEAIINFRIIPGETSQDILNHVKKVTGDERVKCEILDGFVREPAPVSPVGSDGFNAILASLRQVYPEAVVAPTLMLGASDSKHFSVVTDNIYRFAPIVVTSEDMERIHGLNERTIKEEFLRGISFYYQVIKNCQQN